MHLILVPVQVILTRIFRQSLINDQDNTTIKVGAATQDDIRKKMLWTLGRLAMLKSGGRKHCKLCFGRSRLAYDAQRGAYLI